MVNTFIVVKDYTESASLLDVQRLRKQCVEAIQILNILKQLHHIALLLNLPPCPINYMERIEWARSTRKAYLALPYRFGFIDGKMKHFPSKKLPLRLYKNDKYHIEDNNVVYKNKSYPRDNVVLPTDSIYSLGFSQHAIIRMWVGYEESLRDYINCHIKVYCSLKKKDGTPFSFYYPIIDVNNPIKPWWVIDTDYVILSHRASLLRKEQQRREPLHYWRNSLFTSIPRAWIENYGYVWTGSIEPHLIELLMKGISVDPNLVCSPINAALPPKKTQAYLRKKHKYDGSYLLDQDGYVVVKIENQK